MSLRVNWATRETKYDLPAAGMLPLEIVGDKEKPTRVEVIGDPVKPDKWTEYIDDNETKYYHNPAKQVTTWETPKEFIAIRRLDFEQTAQEADKSAEGGTAKIEEASPAAHSLEEEEEGEMKELQRQAAAAAAVETVAKADAVAQAGDSVSGGRFGSTGFVFSCVAG